MAQTCHIYKIFDGIFFFFYFLKTFNFNILISLYSLKIAILLDSSLANNYKLKPST